MYFQAIHQRSKDVKELVFVCFWITIMWLVLVGLEMAIPYLI